MPSDLTMCNLAGGGANGAQSPSVVYGGDGSLRAEPCPDADTLRCFPVCCSSLSSPLFAVTPSLSLSPKPWAVCPGLGCGAPLEIGAVAVTPGKLELPIFARWFH